MRPRCREEDPYYWHFRVKHWRNSSEQNPSFLKYRRDVTSQTQDERATERRASRHDLLPVPLSGNDWHGYPHLLTGRGRVHFPAESCRASSKWTCLRIITHSELTIRRFLLCRSSSDVFPSLAVVLYSKQAQAPHRLSKVLEASALLLFHCI